MKTIVILNDGDTGHLRQCESVFEAAKEIYLRRGIAECEIRAESVAINEAAKHRRSLLERAWRKCRSLFRNRCDWCVPACTKCARLALSYADYSSLLGMACEAVISTGSCGRLNLCLAKQLGGRSITVLNAGGLDVLKLVDLAILPRIFPIPVGQTNVAILEGVPNLINQRTMQRHALTLVQEKGPLRSFRIALLLGGSDSDYKMRTEVVATVLNHLEKAATDHDGDLLITTSRRTPVAVAELVKDRFATNPRCRLLVIANERNRPGTVEAILGVSDVVVLSPDSMSMASEAASSNADVLVFDDPERMGLDRRFLDYFSRQRYLELVPLDRLAMRVGRSRELGAHRARFDDARVLRQSLEAIL